MGRSEGGREGERREEGGRKGGEEERRRVGGSEWEGGMGHGSSQQYF